MTYEVDFKQLKQEVLIDDVIKYYEIAVRESGEQLVADCPFCKSTSGSFKISLEKNAFICHTCKEKGNILDFVAKKEGLNIKDAAVFIANNIRKPNAPDSKTEQPTAPSSTKTFRQVARIIITVEVES
jgi:DNA primase